MLTTKLHYYTIPGIRSVTPLDYKMIPDIICQYYGLKKERTLGKTRYAKYVLARHLMMYFLKKNCKKSLKDIGLMLGRRDHSTVIHGLTQIDNYIFTNDPFVMKDITAIERRMMTQGDTVKEGDATMIIKNQMLGQ